MAFFAIGVLRLSSAVGFQRLAVSKGDVMKKVLWSFGLVFILAVALVVPVFAQGGDPVPTVLTEIQLFVIATLASFLVWLLKFAKQPVSAGWLTTAVYVVAFGLAYIFQPLLVPAFPPFVDALTFVQSFVSWAGAFLLAFSPFVGFATLIYNALLKAVLEKYVRPLFAR